jgi:prephenate dehydrogenase
LSPQEPLTRPDTLAVIGLGAIGGSLAWQASRAGVPRVVGFSPERREGLAALKAGAVTEVADSALRAAREADLVVLATPPSATIELLTLLGAAGADALKPGALVTDVASIKGSIVAAAERVGLGDRFAGGHPLAGTHGTGFDAATPDRLRGCVVYVCATASAAGESAARAVAGFWQETLGASAVRIDAQDHDRQLAWTSHLPQAVASTLAHALATRGLAGVSYGSGGRDTTRLAASSPELWVDIFLQNAPALLDALDAMRADTDRLAELVRNGDRAALGEFLATGAAFRRSLDHASDRGRHP